VESSRITDDEMIRGTLCRERSMAIEVNRRYHGGARKPD